MVVIILEIMTIIKIKKIITKTIIKMMRKITEMITIIKMTIKDQAIQMMKIILTIIRKKTQLL